VVRRPPDRSARQKEERQMSARSGIENTLYRYAWAFDMDHLDEIWQCYTKDVEVTFEELKVGREAVVAEMRRRRDKYREDDITPWHVITNVFITNETETTADVASWFTQYTRTKEDLGTFNVIGWYHDRFKVDDGVWRIHRRRVLLAGDR
jgi:3-phenylpropionate/cinnamic acid dioxygenase small subunit